MSDEGIHGLLLVDKPRGPSSHDVVSRARRALQTKRIGHTGTLDPMATGLLVLAVGEGTKLVAYLTEHDKRYECTIKLGVETDSLDADGSVTREAAVPSYDAATLSAACRELEARTLQVPPMVSAVRIDGERLYERARRGELIDVPSRQVKLHAIEVIESDATQLRLAVRCGKGYYIRALARDLAQLLGTVGHLTQLRRTHVGDDDVANAVAGALLDRASRDEAGVRAGVRAEVIPLTTAVSRMPTIVLDPIGLDHARHGRVVPHENLPRTALRDQRAVVLLDANDKPVAIGNWVDAGIKIARGFVDRSASRTASHDVDQGAGNTNT